MVDRIRGGDLRAVARAISIVEAGGPDARALTSVLQRHGGRACHVGITGPPGAGKSTLAAQLVARYRARGVRVGVLAVDPTSPFTGGALLGDRVRMQAHALDSGVFIRSMATRGHLGGLAASTMDAADVLDAAGFDVTLIETVGVGQDEVDVARVADLCVVVTVPGAGDEVQALKAGVMEIADVFVVNKADRDGADETAAAIEQMMDLDDGPARRRVPVVRVVATTGDGVDALLAAIDAGRGDDVARRARRLERSDWRLREALSREVLDRVRRESVTTEGWHDLVDAIEGRRDSPEAMARRLIDGLAIDSALDHVGIATASIDKALVLYGTTLGFSVGPPEEVPSQGVRVRFVETGAAPLELVEALDDTSSFAAGLRRRGPGLHHIALRVDDLNATLSSLAARGVRLIDRVGRPGAHGRTVAFVHPSSADGVLIELVERGRG